MIALANHVRPVQPPQHARFLAMLPTIVGYARRGFHYLDDEAKEDAVAEIIANCFAAYARLVQLGKEDLAYPSVLAVFAIRQFRDGRRVGNPANCQDAYAQTDLQREYLGTPADQRWKESLIDNARSPVADQVTFRIDFPEWLCKLSARDRRLALQLARGERTSDVACRFGITKGRVSQLRKELHEEWLRFQGELPTGGES